MQGMNVQPYGVTGVVPSTSGMGACGGGEGKLVASRFTCDYCIKQIDHSIADHASSSKTRLNQVQRGIAKTLVSRFHKNGFTIDESMVLASAKMTLGSDGKLSCIFSRDKYPREVGIDAIRQHEVSDQGRSCMHASKIPFSLFFLDTFNNDCFAALYDSHSEVSSDLIIEMAGKGILHNDHKNKFVCVVCDQDVSNSFDLPAIYKHINDYHQISPEAQAMQVSEIEENFQFETIVESDTLTGHAYAVLREPFAAWITDLRLGQGIDKDLSFIIKYFADETEKCTINVGGLAYLLFSRKKFYLKSHEVTADQYHQMVGLVDIKKQAADENKLLYSSLGGSCDSYVSELASLACIRFPGELSNTEMKDHPCTIFLLHAKNDDYTREQRAEVIYRKCCEFMQQEQDKDLLRNFLVRQGYELYELQDDAKLQCCLTSYICSLVSVGKPQASTGSQLSLQAQQSMDCD
ncbi:hypothetical protein GCM10023116_24930 [Kistimonas scapharcae]|uniref:Uncharacterized protein n=2 Tax=Kistimonas scapharcae TaxID=1036133 RepID=A0ABP8V545_9GAMM